VEAQQGHDLPLKLPAGHWQALLSHCQQSAVVPKALADDLDLDHHTLWQLSTSTTEVKGVFGGALQVRDLIDHGDFGLGTFEQLMVKGFFLMGSVGRQGPMAA